VRVQDLMTSPVLTIRADKPLVVVQEIMKWNHVRHVPVVGANGEVIGMVSQRDLLAAAVSTLADKSNADRRQHLAMADVERVMKRDVHSTVPSQSVQGAAAMMRAKRVGSLPVIEDGQLVGIITEADLTRLVEHLPEGAFAGVPTPLPRSPAVPMAV
jgi:CBS domain-containing membrane protein